MHKKLFLFTLLCAVAFSAQAIRVVDIKAALKSPETGDQIFPNQQFQITTVAYNLGPDTFRASDTMFFSLSFDGDDIIFGAGSSAKPYIALTGQEIEPGDSASITLNFSIDQSWPGGVTEICGSMKPKGALDSLNDPVPTNNKGCATVTIVNPSTGVAESKNKGLSLFAIAPNPATTDAVFNIHLKTASELMITLTDLSGRTILKDDKGSLDAGGHILHVNTSALAPGLYMYRIKAGDRSLEGKLQIQ